MLPHIYLKNIRFERGRVCLERGRIYERGLRPLSLRTPLYEKEKSITKIQ
jgi:hypothetical protein